MLLVSLTRVRWRCIVIGSLGLLAAPSAVSGVVSAAPTPDPPPVAVPSDVGLTDPELQASSLVPVPVGCPAPEPADVAFTGTVLGNDDVTQTVRFRLDRVRAGRSDPWVSNGVVDVRYGPDYRFLVLGEQYLIGAAPDSVYGVLSSSVRAPEPMFGGNDVAGVDDVEVDCPNIDDPIRTLQVDGTSIDSGLLTLMTQDRGPLLRSVVVPVAVVSALLFALVLVRMFGELAVNAMLRLARASVTPVPDHRAARVRSHGPRERT